MNVSHGHAHDRGHAHAHGPPLVTALALTLVVAVVECAGGFVSHSLALLSDSAHVFMDAIALGISVAAAWQVRRPANHRRTYGYARFEILAALANGFLLFGVTVAIALEAIRRFAAPEPPHGGSMAVFAAVGLAINLGIGLSLSRAAHGDMNVRAALLHVASDAVGAAAVALGGLALIATHAAWIDPAVSLGVAVLIVGGVVRVVRDAADVLLESAPAHAEIPVVRERMRSLPGVVDVHDLHVWTIGGSAHVLSAHVLLADKRISEASSILRALETTLRDEFAIDHVTIQFECETCEADDRIVCTQIG
ncbi:MAG: cation transporter [Candidatus Eremiobacteraeota bacterium]|nr:cation transporter [Candidatus Eremiobacteraeota bacterium]